ncbi:MAG: ETC complex I subunit [Alphaproteobacteria bacterium]|nr:ETC complex I subunit [Alphaproteobacteria bacterium]
MVTVRIFQPAKTAMQSGRRNTRRWRVEFPPGAPKEIDGLMGWTGSGDTPGQVALSFESKEQAVAFARGNGFDFELADPQARAVKPKAYADNFRSDRVK